MHLFNKYIGFYSKIIYIGNAHKVRNSHDCSVPCEPGSENCRMKELFHQIRKDHHGSVGEQNQDDQRDDIRGQIIH